MAINSEARGLCKHLLQILGNEKNFPKEQEWFTNRLRETALDIDLKCWKANNIRVDKSEELYTKWMNTTRPFGQKEKTMGMIRRTGIPPREMSDLENAQAAAQKNADLIEYLAMMTDVEIPTEEEATGNE